MKIPQHQDKFQYLYKSNTSFWSNNPQPILSINKTFFRGQTASSWFV